MRELFATAASSAGLAQATELIQCCREHADKQCESRGIAPESGKQPIQCLTRSAKRTISGLIATAAAPHGATGGTSAFKNSCQGNRVPQGGGRADVRRSPETAHGRTPTSRPRPTAASESSKESTSSP
jgi:hypothetical protein